MVEEKSGKFSYSGYLVFNEILRLRNADVGQLVKILPRFGDNNRIGAAVKGLNSFSGFHHPEHPRNEEENFDWIEISEEKFNDEVAYVDGEKRRVTIRDVDTTEAWILDENHIAIRGSKAETDKAKRYLSEWGDTIDFEQVKFQPDFLLWLFYKHYTEGGFFKEVGIEQLTDAEVGGNASNFGEKTRTAGSDDITSNATVLIGTLLNDESISMLGGRFRYEGCTIAADLTSSGKVHVKASSGTIREVSDIDRFILSIGFLNALTDLYQHWTNLPPVEKYPPAEFFHTIAERLQMEGFEVQHPIEPTIQEYSEKRGDQSSRGREE